MPRRRVQREPCDCLDCREGFPATSVLGPAIARQQPPPKCLIIYVRDALNAEDSLDSKLRSFPVLDAVIDAGSSGLLAMRPGPESEHLDLENLFCTIDVSGGITGKGAEDRGSSLRNMSAMLVSDCQACLEIGEAAGFSCSQTLAELGLHDSPAVAASNIAKILEFQDLKELDVPQKKKPPSENDGTDLLFLTLGGTSTHHGETAISHLETAEGLLKELSSISNFCESVMLVLLVRMRDTSGTCFPANGGSKLKDVEGYGHLSKPRQSYEFACLDDVQVSRSDFIYCVQRLSYVVRRDTLSAFPWKLKGAGLGDGCILAERLLPSLAYTLSCAPKYGA